MNQRILFCNVAYMQNYDVDIFPETPINGGRYVEENNDAFEKYNFHFYEDGYCRGFVESGYVDGVGGRAREIHIENIDQAFAKKGSISDVTVVFCAKIETGKTVIVGWYKNATVYRGREFHEGRMYNILAKQDDVKCIKEKERNFVVPRAKTSDFGFGQTNYWFANEPAAKDFIQNVLAYIDRTLPDNRNPFDELPSEYSESGIAKKVPVNKYERNREARERCLKKYGAKCAICGFASGEQYGEQFAGVIQVHHIVPISEIKADYKINPDTDLIPVCPNCHMILHTKSKTTGKEPTIDEVRSYIKASDK